MRAPRSLRARIALAAVGGRCSSSAWWRAAAARGHRARRPPRRRPRPRAARSAVRPGPPPGAPRRLRPAAGPPTGPTAPRRGAATLLRAPAPSSQAAAAARSCSARRRARFAARGPAGRRLRDRRHRRSAHGARSPHARRAGGPRLQVLSTLAPVEDRVDSIRNSFSLLGARTLALTALAAWGFTDVAMRPLARLRAGPRASAAPRTSRRHSPSDGPDEVALARRRAQRDARAARRLDAATERRSRPPAASPPTPAMSCARRSRRCGPTSTRSPATPTCRPTSARRWSAR